MIPDPPKFFLLSGLPTETILQVFKDDELTASDRASISLTCRFLHEINNPILYSQNIASAGSSCLFWAAKHGRIATLQRALEAGADVSCQGWLDDEDNDEDATGFTTPLHVAAKFGHRDAAEWLLDHGADIDAPSHRFCDALMDRWTQAFTPAERPRWTPLFAALSQEQTAVAELLVSRQANVASLHIARPGRAEHEDIRISALHVAAAYGMNSVIEMLSSAVGTAFDVDARDYNHHTALHYASHYWSHSKDEVYSECSSIPLLLRLGASMGAINRFGQDPLHQSCSIGNFQAATMFVKAGANLDLTCRSPHEARSLLLKFACRSATEVGQHDRWEEARAELFQALIAAGIDVNDKTTCGMPLLHLYHECENFSAASILIRLGGADVNLYDNFGDTVLQIFLRRCLLKGEYLAPASTARRTAQMLLSHGARIDLPDRCGIDTLHQVVYWARRNIFVGFYDLSTLLSDAKAFNVSEACVEAAIASCARDATTDPQITKLLRDFQQRTWGRGGLL